MGSLNPRTSGVPTVVRKKVKKPSRTVTYVRLLFILADECFIDDLAYQLINLVGVKGRLRVPFCRRDVLCVEFLNAPTRDKEREREENVSALMNENPA
jgi:hypothetical protein